MNDFVDSDQKLGVVLMQDVPVAYFVDSSEQRISGFPDRTNHRWFVGKTQMCMIAASVGKVFSPEKFQDAWETGSDCGTRTSCLTFIT